MAKKMISGHLGTNHGLFYLVLSLPDPKTGKKKPTWFATGLPVKGNRTKANKMLQKARRDATNGILPPRREKKEETTAVPSRSSASPDMLFSDYILMWLHAMRYTWADTTFVAYQRAVTREIAPYFADKQIRLNELTTMDIQEYYASLQRRGMGGNTIIHFHANIRKSLVDAIHVFKLLSTNPAAEVIRPQMDNFEASYYDAEQLTAMLQSFKGSPVELPVMLAAFYGMRRSEVLGLRWKSIDFRNKKITISHTVSRLKLDGQTQMIAKNRTKNKSSFRTLPLIPQVEQALLKAKDAQKYNQKHCKGAYDTRYLEYVCVDEMGTLLNPDRVSRGFTEHLKKHGFPHIRYHDLRHSCASLLLAGGVSLKEIQLWLGHSSFVTTANIYAHLDLNSKKTSANTIENSLQVSV